MMKLKRHEMILDMLLKEQSVKNIDLSNILNVSRQTIRNDIEYLDSIGKLKKVHGGAVIEKKSMEPSLESRRGKSLDEKQAIAEEAAKIIENGDTIYLDIGTTVSLMVPYLKDFDDLTVITNSIYLAYELGNEKNITVICSGGEIRSSELSLSGRMAMEQLGNYYVDKSFIGVGGISEKAGYTDYHIGESEVRKLMIHHANSSVALLDHSKVNVIAVAKYAELEDIETIVTDSRVPEDFLSFLGKKDIQVIIADCAENEV